MTVEKPKPKQSQEQANDHFQPTWAEEIQGVIDSFSQTNEGQKLKQSQIKLTLKTRWRDLQQDQ